MRTLDELPAEFDPAPSAAAGVAGRSAMTQLLAQQAAVAAISKLALTEPALEVLLPELCATVSRVLETEIVSVSERTSDGRSLRIIAGVGWRPGVVGEQVLPGDRGSQAGYTLKTGGPVIVEDLTTERRFTVLPLLVEHGAKAGLTVRIGDEAPFGVLAAFTSRRGRFTRDDVQFLQAVANVLAGAIARQRIEADLRASRDELNTVVGAVEHGIVVTNADGSRAFVNERAAQLSGYGSTAEMLATRTEDRLAHYELFDEDGRPLTPEQLPTPRALAGENPPEMLVRFRVDSGLDRWSTILANPVRDADGRVTRAVTVFRDVTDVKRDADGRRFLAEATAILSETLDRAEASRRLAELCIPQLADWCIVDLREPDGSITAHAIAHADPERVGLARRLREMRPVEIDAPTGVGRVIREGTTEVGEVTPEIIEQADFDAETREMVTSLELRSFIIVPLLARNRAIGALTLVAAESGRPIGPRERQLAEELGARAGVALENALLFETSEDRRAELDAVLASMADAVLVFGPQAELRLANRAGEELFGDRPPASLAELRERLGPPIADPDAPSSDAPAELDGDYRVPGSGRWLELRGYHAAEVDERDRRTPLVVVLRDVTNARAASSAREAFLGLLSHELRTPITTIYAGSQMLERQSGEEQRREVVRDIKEEADRLARLVEDLLVVSRVERGGLDVGDEPVLVQRLVPGIVRSLSNRWPDLKVTQDFAEPLAAARGDETYVEQVVRNLLTNAIRYGNALDSGVTVSAGEEDAEVVVRILDEGPGFDDGDAARLFELFYRTPAARRVPGGAGIGLFVCRHLIESMGGRIWARPRAAGGAEFGFALPVISEEES
jgi:PAS domain S-box-containing protein